jgi:hypothetical protein
LKSGYLLELLQLLAVKTQQKSCGQESLEAAGQSTNFAMT